MWTTQGWIQDCLLGVATGGWGCGVIVVTDLSKASTHLAYVSFPEHSPTGRGRWRGCIVSFLRSIDGDRSGVLLFIDKKWSTPAVLWAMVWNLPEFFENAMGLRDSPYFLIMVY